MYLPDVNDVGLLGVQDEHHEVGVSLEIIWPLVLRISGKRFIRAKKHVIKAVVKVQRQLALVLLSSSTPVRIRIAIASWMQNVT